MSSNSNSQTPLSWISYPPSRFEEYLQKLEKAKSPHNKESREMVHESLLWAQDDLLNEWKNGPVHEHPKLAEKLKVLDLEGMRAPSSACSNPYLKSKYKDRKNLYFVVNFYSHLELALNLEKHVWYKGKGEENYKVCETQFEDDELMPKPMDIDIEEESTTWLNHDGSTDFISRFKEVVKVQDGVFEEFIKRLLTSPECQAAIDISYRASVDPVLFFGDESLSEILDGTCKIKARSCQNFWLAYHFAAYVAKYPWESFGVLDYPSITSAFTDTVYRRFAVPRENIDMVRTMNPNTFVIAIQSSLCILDIIADLPVEERPKLLLTETINLEKNMDEERSENNSIRIQKMAREYSVKIDVPLPQVPEFAGDSILTLYIRS